MIPAAEGYVTVTVPAAACADRAANANTASATATFLFDTTPPTVAIDAAIFTSGDGVVAISVDVPETSVSPIQLTVTMSEAVSDLTSADFAPTGSTASLGALTTSDNIVFTVELTPDGEGTIGLVLPAATCIDEATNDNTESNSLAIVFDTTAPTVAIASSASTHSTTSPYVTNTYPVPLTATFDTPIAQTKFVVGDLSLEACTAEAGSFTATYVDGDYGAAFQVAAVYELGLVPDDHETELVVVVPADVANDIAGNDNTESNSLSFIFDTTVPTVVVTHTITTTNVVTRESPNTMVITFSEPMWGFTIDDITVTNAAKDAFTGSDGDTVFGVDLAPVAEDFVTVQIHSATCQDEATNDNTASTLVTYRYDVTAPLVAILNSGDIIYDHVGASAYDDPGPISNAQPLTITLSFNEPIEHLALTDITVGGGGGTLANLVAVTSGDDLTDGLVRADYYFELTPTSEVVTTLQLAADVLFDDAGNGNAQSNVLTFLWDITQPVPTLDSEAERTTNLYPFPLNITFDSLVTGFIEDDVVISGSGGGGIQRCVAWDYDTSTWNNCGVYTGYSDTYNMVVYALDDGDISIIMNAGQVQDKATNDNVASNSLYFLFDGIPPEVNLSSTNTFTFYTRQAIDILVEFAEPMFQFVASDVVVKDSTYDDSGPIVVDDFVSTNSGATYTATVNPAEGNVTIYVPAASAVDANDNINAYSNTIEFIFDTTGPAPYLNTTISHTEATLDLWTDDTLRTQVP